MRRVAALPGLHREVVPIPFIPLRLPELPFDDSLAALVRFAKSILLTAIGCLLGAASQGQGTVFFANRVTGRFDARVTRMGSEPLDDRFVAQLLAGPTPQSLQPVGIAVPFLNQPEYARGYFQGVPRSIPTVAPGQPAYAKVVAWYRGLGTNYPEAVANGQGLGNYGESGTLLVPRTGTALEPPPHLDGLSGFSTSITLGFDPTPAPIRPFGLPYDPREARTMTDFIPLAEWVMDVAVVGNTAFVAAGYGGLHTFDISNPAQPVRLARVPLDSTMARAIAVRGPYAFIAQAHFSGRPPAPTGLRIVDVTNPAHPNPVSRVDAAGEPQSLELSDDGKFALLSAGDAGLHVIDLRDVTAPKVVATYQPGDRTFGAAVAGTTAFVAGGISGMHILDLAHPENPALLGTYNAGEPVIDVAMQGSLAVVSGRDTGLHIVDVSDPREPRRISGVALAGGAGPSTLVERHIYVQNNWTSLSLPAAFSVVDLRDPWNPALVGRTTVAKEPRDFALGSGWLWVADLVQLTAFPIGPVLQLGPGANLQFTGALGQRYEIQQHLGGQTWGSWSRVDEVTGSSRPQSIPLSPAPGTDSRLFRALPRP